MLDASAVASPAIVVAHRGVREQDNMLASYEPLTDSEVTS
jgi:hypothetical protein